METKIFKCFIASPSDVQTERDICDEVFSEINESIGNKQGFRIESVKWERDAIPAFGSDGQEVINQQLTPGDHDFFIGIWGERIGNPTKHAESGTLEEFNQAYDNWKTKKKPNIQIYFKKSNAAQAETIHGELDDIDNLKSDLSEKGCLYAEYNNVEDFKNILRRNMLKVFATYNQTNIDYSIKKHISDLLEKKLKDSLLLFNNQPITLIDRLLCKSEDMSSSFVDCVRKSVHIRDFLSSESSCIIKAPPQFGLTCLAHAIQKELWDVWGKASLYIDLDSFKFRKYKAIFETEKAFFENIDFSHAIIDSWSVNKTGISNLIDVIENEYPNITIIIMQTEIDSIDIICPPQFISNKSFLSYHLLPLPKSDVRLAVQKYKPLLCADEDIVLNKLVTDMEALNMHRTPMNCWTLLKVAENNFDKNPVNRTQMLELVLFTIFNLSEIPSYKTKPDSKDCEHVLGYFCERLLRNDNIHFSRKSFEDDVQKFCKSKLIELDITLLWNILYDNKIIIEQQDSLFRFKSSFWVYFFAAKRMENDSEFKAFILSEKKYSRYPEIIEFYTGINRDKTDILELLSKDLQSTRNEMIVKLGFPVHGFNPLNQLKWNPKESDIERMKSKLSNDIVHSSAPKQIKDQHADNTYNHLTPYNQDLHKFLEESYFIVFVYQLRSLSRALRNSDYSSAKVRARVFSEIINSWSDIAKVLFMLAPILAQFGKASFGGYGFYLSHSFNRFHASQLLLAIICATPYNVLRLVKDDIASDRLEPLISFYLQDKRSDLSEHFIALYLVNQRPTHWNEEIKKYISRLDKNSFYLGSLFRTMQYTYQFDYMTSEDEKYMKTLIKSCLVKFNTSIQSPTIGQTSKIPDSVLPVREKDKLRQL